ncbi:MAG: ParB N-terminal domain-containing protein [Bifidobacteriaceae bacterium]|nr:ParB N-terminal domain-containing protein [Bifidobacteriaceae bacterium]
MIPAQPVGGIQTGGGFRADVGDVAALEDSIRRLGLLSPVVVTPGLALVSGARRLAAVARLGWEAVPAWVAEGVSDRLSQVLAARDIDGLRKALTPIEQAELYAELEELLAAEARRRKQATQYKPGHPAAHAAAGAPGTPPDPRTPAPGPGPGDSPGPAEPASGRRVPADGGPARPGPGVMAPPAGRVGGPGPGEARVEAAKRVTGRDSHQRLERINELRAIAADPLEDALVREAAADALVELNQDGRVDPRWQRVKLAQALAGLRRAAQDPSVPDQARAAAGAAIQDVSGQPGVPEALREVRRAAAEVARLRGAAPGPGRPASDPEAAGRRQVRQLVEALRREHGWWDRSDPALFGRLADQDQWAVLTTHVAGAAQFLDRAAAARQP